MTEIEITPSASCPQSTLFSLQSIVPSELPWRLLPGAFTSVYILESDLASIARVSVVSENKEKTKTGVSYFDSQYSHPIIQWEMSWWSCLTLTLRHPFIPFPKSNPSQNFNVNVNAAFGSSAHWQSLLIGSSSKNPSNQYAIMVSV